MKSIYFYTTLINAGSELHEEANAASLPDEDIANIAKIAEAGFSQIQLWVDGSAGAAYRVDKEGDRRDISSSKKTYYQRIRKFVDYAHTFGIKTHLYTTWALAVRRFDAVVGAEYVFETSIGLAHRDKYTLTRDSLCSLDIVRDVNSKYYPVAIAALGYPQMRAALVEYYLELVLETNADGLQLEPLSMPLDKEGVSIYGYEAPIVEGFESLYGKSVYAISNSDQSWIDYRCSFATALVQELAAQLKNKCSDIRFSVVGYSFDDNRRNLFSWQDILKLGLVDEFYLRVSLVDPQKSIEIIKKARPFCKEVGIELITVLDLKSYTEDFTDKQKTINTKKCEDFLLESSVEKIGYYGNLN